MDRVCLIWNWTRCNELSSSAHLVATLITFLSLLSYLVISWPWLNWFKHKLALLVQTGSPLSCVPTWPSSLFSVLWQLFTCIVTFPVRPLFAYMWIHTISINHTIQNIQYDNIMATSLPDLITLRTVFERLIPKLNLTSKREF